MNRPSIYNYLPQSERDCILLRIGKTGRSIVDTGSPTIVDGSVSFGTETREYFGSLPAEIVRAVPESVINCIACTVFEAHRTGRRDAYTSLKDFVLERLEAPDWAPRYHAQASANETAFIASGLLDSTPTIWLPTE